MPAKNVCVHLLQSIDAFDAGAEHLVFEKGGNLDAWASEVLEFLNKIGISTDWTETSPIDLVLLSLNEGPTSALSIEFANPGLDSNHLSFYGTDTLNMLIGRYIIWSTISPDVRQMLLTNFNGFSLGGQGTNDGFPSGWAQRLGTLYNAHVQAAVDDLKAKQAKRKFAMLKKKKARHTRALEKVTEELRVLEQMNGSDLKVEDSGVEDSKMDDSDTEDSH